MIFQLRFRKFEQLQNRENVAGMPTQNPFLNFEMSFIFVVKKMI